jgi:hypothetical protein
VTGPRRRSYVDARLTPDGELAPVTPEGLPDAGSDAEPARSRPGPGHPTAAPGAHGDPVLVDVLRDEITRAGGGISFARFMELALYHPERGYYATSDERPTRSGDFLTAPEVHPMFGRLLARQLDEMWLRLDRPARFVLREHGSGRGVLGETILGGLAAEGSALLEAIRYEPVDVQRRALVARDRVQDAGFGHALDAAQAAETSAPARRSPGASSRTSCSTPFRCIAWASSTASSWSGSWSGGTTASSRHHGRSTTQR